MRQPDQKLQSGDCHNAIPQILLFLRKFSWVISSFLGFEFAFIRVNSRLNDFDLRLSAKICG